MSLFHRVRQTVIALTAKPDETCQALVDRYLTAHQADAFRLLSTHDQAHLCRVCTEILDFSDATDDLIVAALLHDIGKVSDRGRVRLADRIFKVVLRRISPSLLRRLAARPGPRLLEGLSLAVHHPALGAHRAAELGCSDRVCWLIAHHEDESHSYDKDLCLLVAVDRETV